MYRCYRNNCCNKSDNGYIEDKCENVCNIVDDEYNECNCGFSQEKTVFPLNPMLAQSYVPIQTMGRTFSPCTGLEHGTIFPELATMYCPGQSMKDIEYLKARNEIGKGCNTCS